MTIVGEPGVGKSRLCAELFGYIEDRPGLVRWRQGRSLPYGEGIAFWALGEIVKAECGILESDSPEEAEAKLGRALPADDPDLAWLKARLAPLVGRRRRARPRRRSRSRPGAASSSSSPRAGDGARLRGPALGRRCPAVLPGASGRLGGGRPPAPRLHRPARALRAAPTLRRRARGTRSGSTSRRSRDVETARLLVVASRAGGLPAETQRALLERAGGNPLYAEEFVRLLADRELLSERSRTSRSRTRCRR